MVVKGYPFQKGFDCMKKFYLAYGSNLNVKQMQFRCPDARIVGTAEIPNYQLLFKGSKTGSYLTIEPKQGCTVPVAVWSVSERDELALDRYEGYPHFYYKTELELPLAETRKKLTAFVYIMHEERKLGIPTSAYIRTCVDGYRQFGFDLKHLRKVPVPFCSRNGDTPHSGQGQVHLVPTPTTLPPERYSPAWVRW